MPDEAYQPPLSFSEARAALDFVEIVARRLGRRAQAAFEEEAASTRMIREFGLALDRVNRPSGDVLEEIRSRLREASDRGSLDRLGRKDRRYAPWLLWNGTPPGASIPGVLSMVLEDARGSVPSLRRLVQAYLRDYSPGAPGIGDAAECIRQRLPELAEPRFAAWQEAHRSIRLFDPETGPRALASRLLATDDQDSVLGRYGLADPILTKGGCLLAAEDAVREAAPAFLRDGGIGALRIFLGIVAPGNDGLRFDYRRADTARALLGAWLTGPGQPAAAVQEEVRRLVLSWLGDPRLPDRRQAWQEVGTREAGLVRAWLTRASLDLFFRLIDEHALDAQWRYRQAFWAAYLRMGAISDAWLAFGPRSLRSAKTVPDLGQAYATLTGGVDRQQSALLLRIGPLIISEFSHNGRLYAWPADSRGAPEMGRSSYYRDELRQKCLAFPPNPWSGRGGDTSGSGLRHDGSPIGTWQGSAALLIERHTGVKITSIDWRPR